MSKDYPYYWRVKTRLPERKGTSCRILTRGSKNSILVEFEDGYKVVTSGWSVRNFQHSIATCPCGFSLVGVDDGAILPGVGFTPCYPEWWSQAQKRWKIYESGRLKARRS